MENQKTVQNGDYEEIDLRDIINILIKGKGLIIILTIVSVAVVLVANIMLPKTYRSKSVIAVGSVIGLNDTKEMMEPVSQIKDKVDRGIYTELLGDKIGLRDGNSYKVTGSIAGDSNVISISAESTDIEGSIKLLRGISEIILNDHFKKSESVRIAIESEIVTAQSDIDQIKSNIDSLMIKKEKMGTSLSYLEKAAGADASAQMQFAIFSAIDQVSNKEIEMGNMFAAIDRIEARVSDLKKKLGQIEKTTEIIEPATDSSVSTGLGAVRSAILGAAVGLFMGVIAVLFRHWWKVGVDKK